MVSLITEINVNKLNSLKQCLTATGGEYGENRLWWLCWRAAAWSIHCQKWPQDHAQRLHVGLHSNSYIETHPVSPWSSGLCVIQTISVPSSQGWVGDALRHTIVECRWHTASGGQRRLVQERLMSTLWAVCQMRTDGSPVNGCLLGRLSPRCMPWTSWNLKLTLVGRCSQRTVALIAVRRHRLSAFFQEGTTYTSQMLHLWLRNGD